MRVFVQEQGVPMEEELDEDDQVATHAIAIISGDTVGTGRVVYPSLPNIAAPFHGEPKETLNKRLPDGIIGGLKFW